MRLISCLPLQIPFEDIGNPSTDAARLLAQGDNFNFENVAAVGILLAKVLFHLEARRFFGQQSLPAVKGFEMILGTNWHPATLRAPMRCFSRNYGERLNCINIG